tara:strand:- start:1140 stop:1367 length:228 start_codon:yes stop_codon:yes gene_type:complete
MVRKTRRGGLIRNNQLTPTLKEYRIIALMDEPITVREATMSLDEAKKLADLTTEQKNVKCYVLDDSNRSVYRTKD